MSECDDCDNCSCGDRNKVKLCETCGGIGQVSKTRNPIKYLRLWKQPQETEECPDCKGSGIEKNSKGL